MTLLDAFEDRRMLIAYYFMWYSGRSAPVQTLVRSVTEPDHFLTSAIRAAQQATVRLRIAGKTHVRIANSGIRCANLFAWEPILSRAL